MTPSTVCQQDEESSTAKLKQESGPESGQESGQESETSGERRRLQAAVVIGGLVPVAAGLAGIVFGPALLIDPAACDASCDSHGHYLSGLLLGIGLAFWSLVPDIERAGVAFRLLTGLVVTGGLARLLSLAMAGVPSKPMLGALMMELAVTPLLCLWQARIARRRAA